MTEQVVKVDTKLIPIINEWSFAYYYEPEASIGQLDGYDNICVIKVRPERDKRSQRLMIYDSTVSRDQLEERGFIVLASRGYYPVGDMQLSLDDYRDSAVIFAELGLDTTGFMLYGRPADMEIGRFKDRGTRTMLLHPYYVFEQPDGWTLELLDADGKETVRQHSCGEVVLLERYVQHENPLLEKVSLIVLPAANETL